MTRIAIGLFLAFAILFSAFGQGQVVVKKGDTATVSTWIWVDVKNPDSVKSGNVSYSYGDRCGVERGGRVTVIGIEGNRLLVRYSVDGNKYGTPCPSGIIFFTAKEEFSRMTSEYRRIRDVESNEKSLILRLLKKK